MARSTGSCSTHETQFSPIILIQGNVYYFEGTIYFLGMKCFKGRKIILREWNNILRKSNISKEQSVIARERNIISWEQIIFRGKDIFRGK